ncbi:MAG: hypothetical protein P9M14_12830 [Candidatus Alcyoniella australis]|nr:hypothetical protein [Candidatus Alcyoniella australis]
MSTAALQKFIMEHFQAHAIKGDLKPGRKYQVIETSPTQMIIRTRGKNSRRVQTLFADLVTCKSLRYGEFRRVDLFWGVGRKDKEAGAKPHRTKRAAADGDTFSVSIPVPEFTADGDPIPVDTFISSGLGLSARSRKEKAS